MFVIVYTTCVHYTIVVNNFFHVSFPKGFLALFAGDTGEIKTEVRDQIDVKVSLLNLS